MPRPQRKRLLQYAILAAFLAAVSGIAGCIFYLVSGYDSLKGWYLSLSAVTLYQKSAWAEKFFTPGTKHTGNAHCIIALLCLAAAVAALMYKWRKLQHATLSRIFYRWPGPVEAIVLLSACGFWAWGMKMAVPAYDEVFSAVNFAPLHPFQTWSFYPLPNNHVLFNTVNSVLFFWVDDKLLTARIISFAAYLGIASLLFRWLRRFTAHEGHAACITLLLLIQFQVWTFSFQGRGYELYALCAWVAITGTLDYMHAGKRQALGWVTAACVAGMAAVPTYLYVQVALVLYSFFVQIARRRWDWRFWKHQVCVAAGVYLFYVPVLLFSGSDAVLNNHYVAPMNFSIAEFLPFVLSLTRQAIQYSGGYMVDDRNLAPLVLALLPALGFFFLRDKKMQRLSLLWALLAFIMMSMTLYQRRFPFVRNLIAHYSYTLCMASLVIYSFFGMIAVKLRRPVLLTTATGLLCIILGVHFIRFNRLRVNTQTYMYDAGLRYQALAPAADHFPKGTKIGLSDECFYWEYLLARRGCSASKGSSGREDYFIRMNEDVMPAVVQRNYDSMNMVQEYIIYRRKRR